VNVGLKRNFTTINLAKEKVRHCVYVLQNWQNYITSHIVYRRYMIL